MGVQAGAVSTKGVLGDACAAGYRERIGTFSTFDGGLFFGWVDFGSRG